MAQEFFLKLDKGFLLSTYEVLEPFMPSLHSGSIHTELKKLRTPVTFTAMQVNSRFHIYLIFYVMGKILSQHPLLNISFQFLLCPSQYDVEFNHIWFFLFVCCTHSITGVIDVLQLFLSPFSSTSQAVMRAPM